MCPKQPVSKVCVHSSNVSTASKSVLVQSRKNAGHGVHAAALVACLRCVMDIDEEKTSLTKAGHISSHTRKSTPPIAMSSPAAKAKEPETKPSTASTATPATSQASLFTSLQFAWFVGHLVTVLSFGLYLLTYLRIFPKCSKFWYKLALVGVIESFGLLIFQFTKKNGTNIKMLARDDNVQYLALALSLLVFSPYVMMTLAPFVLFSTFHVLSYTRNTLLPHFGIPETHSLSVQIENFVSSNNNKSISLAALLEVYTLFLLFLRLITFRPTSVVPFFSFVLFITLRFNKSAYTRSAIKSVEVRIDELVGRAGVPAIKSAWVAVKGVIAKFGSSVEAEVQEKKQF